MRRYADASGGTVGRRGDATRGAGREPSWRRSLAGCDLQPTAPTHDPHVRQRPVHSRSRHARGLMGNGHVARRHLPAPPGSSSGRWTGLSTRVPADRRRARRPAQRRRPERASHTRGAAASETVATVIAFDPRTALRADGVITDAAIRDEVATALRTLADYASPASKPVRPRTAPGAGRLLNQRTQCAGSRTIRKPSDLPPVPIGPVRNGDGAQRGAEATQLRPQRSKQRGRPGKRGLVHASLDVSAHPGRAIFGGRCQGMCPMCGAPVGPNMSL